eukprot:COSAG02_NODE_7771_length_2854_cov_7.933575_3_plen_57_part_00
MQHHDTARVLALVSPMSPCAPLHVGDWRVWGDLEGSPGGKIEGPAWGNLAVPAVLR